MRELKFRFWDSKSKLYTCIDGINEDGEPFNVVSGYTGGYADFKQNIIIEQFTGMYDLDGKEIYEGDIVERGGSRLVVKFIAPYFGAVTKKDYDHFLYPEDKVIGNINENPELFKYVKNNHNNN